MLVAVAGKGQTEIMNILSFGGGVQTVTIVFMSILGHLQKPDYAIFADPQNESAETYKYIEWLKPQMFTAGIPLIVKSKGNICENTLSGKRFASMPVFTRTEGEVGKLRRQCTNEYKVQVVYQAIREILGLTPRKRIKQDINVWLGISRDEAHRMGISKFSRIKNIYPLIEKDMSRQGCIRFLKEHNIPIPPKSSCIVCPYHGDRYWRDMKASRPNEFLFACDFDRKIRTNACRKTTRKGEIFLHRSCKPLDEVKFDDGNYELWGEECAGHCGV